ncbi:MAG: hypothetical protein II983_05745, partial [Firmicutes bacterium]|nr:hypothetical protein [Bacillota bacterium]
MRLQKILSSALAAVLLLQGMAAAVGAELKPEIIRTEVVENPAYAGLRPERVHREEVPGETQFSAGTEELPKADVYYSTIADFTAAMEQSMINRESEVVIGVTSELFDPLYEKYGDNAATVVMESVGEHGKGLTRGGDYLAFHTEAWWASFYEDGDGWTLIYDILYYSTAEQEKMVDEAVAKLVSEWKAKGLTGLNAIETIYNYITTTVEYDYDGLEAYGEAANQDALTQEHMEIFTAYAALIKKTSVCQGYATLFYRLATEMGIDARFISGWGDGGNGSYESHGWNIVEWN